MTKVVWPGQVIDQLDQIKSYIRVFDPPAADRITADLVGLGNSLVAFPGRGRPGPDGTRQLTTVPPYVLTYEIEGEFVVIVDVRHGRRSPFVRRRS